jgi:hypothetical protein
MAMSRAQQLKQLLPGLNALFGLEYKRYKEEYKDLYESDSSDRSFEEEVKLWGFGAAPVKKEGVAITYDNAGEGWTARYTHETIAMGFAITEEAMEDNLYASLSARYTKELAKAMSYTKNVKAAYPFNNGFGSGYLAGDGQYLFDTDHPLAGGGTISNRPTTGVDLNETALEAACIAIAKWTDDRGLLMSARPVKLIIPVDYTFTATRILQSELRVGTADNDPNALRVTGAIPSGFAINHFFTDTNAWFLKTDVTNGAKHFTRVGMKTAMEGDFDTGNVRYKARERYCFGFSDYLSYYGSPGAS